MTLRTYVQDRLAGLVVALHGAAVTGHKTESIYKRYAVVSEQDIAEELGRVSGWTQGRTQVANESL